MNYLRTYGIFVGIAVTVFVNTAFAETEPRNQATEDLLRALNQQVTDLKAVQELQRRMHSSNENSPIEALLRSDRIEPQHKQKNL